MIDITMHKTRKTFAAILMAFAVVALPLAGCGGRAANPIAVAHPGDKDMSCDEIEAEMYDMDARARQLMGEESRKTGKNVALGVAGLFFLVPLFFMDLSDAERHEAQAMQDRGRHLLRLYNKKDCDDEDS